VQNILSFESCVCDWEIGGTVEIEGAGEKMRVIKRRDGKGLE
jgi:hypothetical protein